MAKKKKSVRKEKYANLAAPKAELDFHELGLLTRKEIIGKLNNFIDECAKKNLDKILVITGKGLHSINQNAVVKPTVLKALSNNDQVESFTLARRDRGGEGAVEVNLY